MKWRNWSLVMCGLLGLIALMLFPFTRRILLWILPLGSGMDDLVFFALLFLALVLVLVRVLPVENKLKALVRWFTK